MTELEIYNEMANIVLYLLRIKRLESPIDPKGMYNHTIDQLYEVIDSVTNKLPINATTLNQFVKLVRDAKRFKPIQNRKIYIYKRYDNETTITFSFTHSSLNVLVTFDDNEIKTICNTYEILPYIENYDYIIRDGINTYFKECVNIVFYNRKKGR